jgi:hypothetical protein
MERVGGSFLGIKVTARYRSLGCSLRQHPQTAKTRPTSGGWILALRARVKDADGEAVVSVGAAGVPPAHPCRMLAPNRPRIGVMMPSSRSPAGIARPCGALRTHSSNVLVIMQRR